MLCNHKMETKTKEKVLNSLSFAKSVCMCVCNGVRKQGEGKGGGGSSAVVSLLSAQIFLIQCLIKWAKAVFLRFNVSFKTQATTPVILREIYLNTKSTCLHILRNFGLLGMMCSDVGENIQRKVSGMSGRSGGQKMNKDKFSHI